MKKIVTLILMLCMILSLSACGKVEITMQEIYDANQTKALLKNHDSVYVRNESDGEYFDEKYLTQDYIYDYIHDEEFDWVEFTTDDANYYCLNGDYVRFWTITPDGVSSDFASYRTEYYASAILGADTVDEIIESVSKKDGRITVTSSLSQKNIEDMAEYGVTAGKFEYVLDAKTREIVALNGDYTYDDGTGHHVDSEVSYDIDAPERVREFLKYANETENLRNITVVSNPGTEKEVSQSIQAAKGLAVDFRYEEEEYVFEVYADAACTELYDPYVDTDSDQTIYVKWVDAESETPELTLQDIYDASNVAALLKNHDSVHILYTGNGEVFQEDYYSKEQNYSFYKGEEFNDEFFMTDHSYYMNSDKTVRLVLLTPSGMAEMKDVFANEHKVNIFSTNLLNDIITSVTEKDGCIIMTSVSDQEEIDSIEGLVSCEEELVLDAKTYDLISVKSIFRYEDEVYEGTTTFTYDVEIPEIIKTFMEYDQQTEDMRTITVVSNPGTEQEKTESVLSPKGLIVGLSPEAAYADRTFTLYTDAACTQPLEEAPDVNADVTVYIKWDE